MTEGPVDLQSISSNLLSELTTYRDIFMNKTSIDIHDTVRDTVSVHALNHVMKWVLQNFDKHHYNTNCLESDGEHSRTTNAWQMLPKNLPNLPLIFKTKASPAHLF